MPPLFNAKTCTRTAHPTATVVLALSLVPPATGEDPPPELGVARERTFVDTTGGTVPMSLRVFQRAGEVGVSGLYVRGRPRMDEPGEARFVVAASLT